LVAAERSATKTVPFKASGVWWGLTGDIIEREGFNCADLGGYLDSGAGVINVTHLGRSNYGYVNCWDADFETILYQTGSVTAANGDELFWDGPGEGGWEVWAVDWEAGTYTMGPLSFSGGTGRFEEATGAFVSFGDAVLGESGWTGTEHWEGVISSVGSAK
jgi:hypothetical protein